MSKILIVDDSFDLLEVMKYFLEEKGYDTEVCNNKKEILSLIKSFNPDLIILDIFLAGADGREICRNLKADPATKGLCILIFSASPKALENYKEYGADDCIEKPFGLNQLLEKIEATLEICKDA